MNKSNIVIIILSICLALSVGYIVGAKFDFLKLNNNNVANNTTTNESQDSTNNTTKESNPTTTTDDYKEVAINSNLQEKINMLSKHSLVDYATNMFDGNSHSVTTLNKNALMDMVFANVTFNTNTNNISSAVLTAISSKYNISKDSILISRYVSASTVQSTFKELYGNNVAFEKVGLDSCPTIAYVSSTDSYYDFSQCGGTCGMEYTLSITKVEENSKYAKAYITANGSNCENQKQTYNYIYTFTKENNNYYFLSMDIVK